ncbi:MAG: acetyl-CoA C-acetyltransferase, partial [Paraglaciecola sp.]
MSRHFMKNDDLFYSTYTRSKGMNMANNKGMNMANARDVVIVGAARTAIGSYGGTLKDIAASELGAIAVKEAFVRAKVDPADVGQIVFGNVIHTEARDMYVSRVAGMNAG